MQGISTISSLFQIDFEEVVDSEATLPVSKSISSAKVCSKFHAEAMTCRVASTGPNSPAAQYSPEKTYDGA